MLARQQAVLVTGAGGGIGLTLCTAFREAGYFTIGSDLTGRDNDCNCDHFIDADLGQLVADAGRAKEFAKHRLTELDGYTNVTQIEKSLKLAKMAQERQKDRE